LRFITPHLNFFKTLMRSITLRRTKNSKIDGKPILSLPEKYQSTRKVALAPIELQVYQSIEARAQDIFDTGTVVRGGFLMRKEVL
jgi:SNF2 family DNA or RNA helicase